MSTPYAIAGYREKTGQWALWVRVLNGSGAEYGWDSRVEAATLYAELEGENGAASDMGLAQAAYPDVHDMAVLDLFSHAEPMVESWYSTIDGQLQRRNSALHAPEARSMDDFLRQLQAARQNER